MNNNLISFEYIRGLIEGEGTFTFSTHAKAKRKVPAFAITMHVRDKELLEMVRDRLSLKSRIYVYNYPGKDGAHRGPRATLIVREFAQLKNTIIPLCYEKLKGNKRLQFLDWLESIGADPWVSQKFKFLHQLHRDKFYSKNPKFES